MKRLVRVKVTEYLQLSVDADTGIADLDELLRDQISLWKEKIKKFQPEVLDVDFEWAADMGNQ